MNRTIISAGEQSWLGLRKERRKNGERKPKTSVV